MKTAVEILADELKKNHGIDLRLYDEFNQAKEIEKKQIMDAFWNGDNTDCTSEQNSKEFAEQYYNKTFKSK